MAAAMAAAKATMEPNIPCPRCGSTETKFSYFNNCSIKQPRYFCKGCGRFWTKGGALRDIPIGGGYRKGSKRRRKATSSSSQPQRQPLFFPEDFPNFNFSKSFIKMFYEDPFVDPRRNRPEERDLSDDSPAGRLQGIIT